MPTDAREGGCLCGAIRYRVEGPPRAANVCHCTQCLRHTGALMPSFGAWALDRFRLRAGAPATWRSSSFAVRQFCAACGSPLFWRRDGADELDVYLGTLDDPVAAPAPRDQIWSKHRPGWLPPLAGIPDHPEARPPR